MILSTTKTGTGFTAFKAVHAVFFVIAMITFNLNAANAWATSLRPDDIRVLGATRKFADTWQYAAVFKLRPPRRLRADHTELAVGVIASRNDTRPYLSLGPVWRLPLGRYSNSFVDLGISATLIAGNSFDGRDMGGDIHFTSSVSVGRTFGASRKAAVSLRIQHISNGGIHSTNPGLDMIGLNFRYDIGGEQT